MRLFFGEAAVEAACGNETTLVRKCGCFRQQKNYKFAWFQSLALSLRFLVIEWTSLHLAFSGPVSWHPIKGENNYKEVSYRDEESWWLTRWG